MSKLVLLVYSFTLQLHDFKILFIPTIINTFIRIIFGWPTGIGTKIVQSDIDINKYK